MSGYAGPDCSQKLCEVGNAWVDLPTADDTAHGRYAVEITVSLGDYEVQLVFMSSDS